MDRHLHALVKIDVAADLVRIDVRGSLTQDSRPALVSVIRRIRGMGINANIRVDLSHAALVESPALASLRNDLNAIDGGSSDRSVLAGSAVSIDLMPRPDRPADDGGQAWRTLEIPGNVVASVEPLESGLLAQFSDDELLAASDSVFGKLDDPAAVAGTDLLAQYDAIGLELSRRECAEAFRKEAADETPGRSAEPAV